jgi:CyaY protein
MNDSEFHALADAIYQHIEECIDQSGESTSTARPSAAS